MIFAKDCKCAECGKQAVAFWPASDPDIPSHPYCRECLDKIKMKLWVELMGIHQQSNNKTGGVHESRKKR